MNTTYNPKYELTLSDTYYKKGFFNVGVAAEKLVRNDNGRIKIFLGSENQYIYGRVDRNANRNKTPRIYGNAPLRDWFQGNFALGSRLFVYFLRSDEILLEKIPSNHHLNEIKPTTEYQQKLNDSIVSHHKENYQRIDSASNTQAGADFEQIALRYFQSQGFNMRKGISVKLGFGKVKKNHRFDLGCDSPGLLVECKSHRWTASYNTPSAKMTVWNEAMYYFLLAPVDYRKVLFVLYDFNPQTNESLAEYYIRTYGHMIPPGVEILEYNQSDGSVRRLSYE